MSKLGVIRLEENGPAAAGLSDLELDPADFQSELPEQKWHIYHQDTKTGLTVGVWSTTSMQEAFGPYPGDEFMHILEGRVVLQDGDENEEIVNEGQTFVVRNGIPVSWKQEGFCKKFFMTYLSPDTATPKIDTTMGGIKILNEQDLATKMEISLNSEGVKQGDAEAFKNDTGNLEAGLWETEAFETAMEPFHCHEFAQMLSGDVTIIEENGDKHDFTSGDCFFIPAGTICSWKSTGPFRKFYCSLSPAPYA